MKRVLLYVATCMACLAMVGCGPSRQAAAEFATSTALAATSAVETQLASQTPSPTPTSEPTLTPLPPTATTSPTPSLTPTRSSTPLPCDVVGFVDDVTIPDGTQMQPGESFTKTWRLRNDGTCNWTGDYRLVFVSGTQMGGPALKAFITDWVYPGYKIDVSVDLVAPSVPGTYTGYWKLQNAAGVVFGSAPFGAPFYVQIVVVAPGPTATATP
jgi:hypothetical protein